MKNLKTAKRLLERRKVCKQNIDFIILIDSDQPSFTEMSRDKWHWQTYVRVWDHVCHLRSGKTSTNGNYV